ncbi:hypothetical protein [Priestia megaterium]|uniref:hypothetical protein n=1 Tax=Priestia megaterium TaxID=1404 RepID=UPI000BFD62D2|nr:hypothetical protein [Priestia megaterium]PGQ88374.1 hypothetical protein COA18_05435 [Priestia megaterium]
MINFDKYTVIENEDVRCLSYENQSCLEELLQTIKLNRVARMLEPAGNYIVVNKDEPYAAEIIEILKRHGCWE